MKIDVDLAGWSEDEVWHVLDALMNAHQKKVGAWVKNQQQEGYL